MGKGWQLTERSVEQYWNNRCSHHMLAALSDYCKTFNISGTNIRVSLNPLVGDNLTFCFNSCN